MLMLENASRSYRCTCLAHACTAFSLFTHRSSRLQLSLASVHPRSGRSSWRTFCVHRCSSFSREHVACVTLKYAPFMLPCSRTPCAHRRSFLQQPCASLALIVATSSLLLATALCTLIVHSSSLTSSLILSISIVRSSTLELEKLLRSSLLVHAHARERLACVLHSSTLPLRSLARERLRSCAHRRSCLQQP
jgi:hypothetical protein